MKAIHIQWFLSFIFLSLGGWAMLAPDMVEALVLKPEHYIGTQASHLFVACFGAQAVLCGIVILMSRFTPHTFLVFGFFASFPFFAFNYYFYFVQQIFTDWMLLDFVGNIGILVCGVVGYKLSLREQNHAEASSE